MNRWLVLIGLVVLPLAAAVSDNSTLPGWFDYRDCDFCKIWGAHPGLIAHSTDEIKDISDGIVWITSAESAFRKQLDTVEAAEGKLGEEMSKGKSLKLCQACKRIADFGSVGVRIESVQGSKAYVTVFTSRDSTQVQKLHAFGVEAMAQEARANAEFLAAQKVTK